MCRLLGNERLFIQFFKSSDFENKILENLTIDLLWTSRDTIEMDFCLVLMLEKCSKNRKDLLINFSSFVLSCLQGKYGYSHVYLAMEMELNK